MTSPQVAWPRRTGELVLRPPTSDDLDRVLEWRNRPEVTGWLLRTTVDPSAFRRAWLDSVDDPDDHAVVAVLDGVVIGTGSLEVRDGMGQFQLHRVTAGCFADNVASWRVMEKLGMRREQHGVRDSWHAELGWIDGFTYAILAEEWATRRAGRPGSAAP